MDGNPLLLKIFNSLDDVQNNPQTNIFTPGSKHLFHQQIKAIMPMKLSFNEEDLKCLSDHVWICDNIIDSSITLMARLSSRNVGYTNTFFYKKLCSAGPQAASHWEGFTDGPISKYDQFLIPICLGIHWILASFDFQHKKLIMLDSLSSTHDKVARKLNNFLIFLGLEPLPVEYPPCPQQHNGDDCGVFVIMFCHTIFFEEDLFSFSQKDIPMIRKQIKAKLISAKNN